MGDKKVSLNLWINIYLYEVPLGRFLIAFGTAIAYLVVNKAFKTGIFMKLKKAVLTSLLLSSITGLSFAAYLHLNKGLDNNSDANLDPTLETISTEEEVFHEVAHLISGFVITQKEIRKEIYDKYYSPVRSIFTSESKNEKMINILSDLPEKGLYATRDVHRKTHGCFEAKLQVENDVFDKINYSTLENLSNRSQKDKGPLPELLNTHQDLGVFRPGATYNAVVRLSNGHPGNRHDKLPDARGFAVKILTEDINLKNHEADEINKNTLLDILTINYPTFFVNSATKYLAINKWFLKSAEDDRDALSNLLLEGYSIFAPEFLKGAGVSKLESVLALQVNGSIITNPLHETYFSMVPSRLGTHGSARAVKYSWEPVACDEKLGTFNSKVHHPEWAKDHTHSYPVSGQLSRRQTPPFKDNYNHYYLRERAEQTLKKSKFCYGLFVQLYKDDLSTNIEDSTDIWLRDENERKDWINRVVKDLGDSPEALEYKNKILAKKLAPKIKVAQLEIGKISPEIKIKNSKKCEDLSFNPWNGNIDYHKPLGQVSRMKQKVYNAVRSMRHGLNSINSSAQERSK